MRVGRVFLLAAAVVCWSGMPGAFGKEKDSVTYYLQAVAGTVVDSAGSPAARAKVCLLGGNQKQPPVVVEEFTTDSGGRFQIAQRKIVYAWRTQRHPSLFVVDEKGRIGGVGYMSMGPQSGQGPREIRVRLYDVKDYRGRIVNRQGQPLAGVEIRPAGWHSSAPGESSGEDRCELPAGAAAGATVRSGDDGSFVLRGLPAKGSAWTEMTAEGFGKPRVALALDREVTIRLERAGSARGTLVADPGGAAVGKATINAYSDQVAEPGERKRPDVLVTSTGDGETDERGNFQFDALSPGKYRLALQLAEESPYYVDAETKFEIKPGEATTVTVPLKRAVAVRGKVVDRATGKGIRDIQLYFYSRGSKPNENWGRSITTDGEGRFTLYARPGRITVSPMRNPEGYIAAANRQTEPVEVTKDTEWPTIQFEPAAAIEGVVVDDADKPVAGADVWYLTRDSNSMTDHGSVTSDASGRFTLKKGLPKDPVCLRVRSAAATSDGPVVVIPAEQKGPVKIVLSPKTAFRLRGTVVDEAGVPVRSATVGLRTTWLFGGGGIGFQMTSTTTDAKGRFTFRGLWPGDQYDLLIDTEGYAKQQTAQITAKAGKTHDFGKIIVASTRAVVEGTVVDSAGKPVGDAAVFNSGDAPDVLSTTTTADGRFRLTGFRSGKVHVFASHKGYRFTAVEAETNKDRVTLTMLRLDEPVPERPNSDELTFDQQKQLVAKALDRLIEARGEKEMANCGAIGVMARIDPERAVKWSKSPGSRWDYSVLGAIARDVARSDPEEALAIVGSSGYRRYLVAELAKKLVDSNPAAAMRFAEEMAVEARSAAQPQRALGLAEAGSLIVRAGNPEAGRKLIDEAAGMIGRMGRGKSQRQAAAEVAKAVAMVDPDRAVELAKASVPANEQSWRLRSIAAAAAWCDLGKAEEIAKSLDPWYAQQIVVPIAYQLSRTRPKEALTFVRRFGKQQNCDGLHESQALGWVAVAIAPTEPKKAWALIDEALDLCVDPNADRRSWNNRNARSTVAALLALQAARTGYPDMESVGWRVLASRATTKDTWSPMEAVEKDVVTAMILAMSEPRAARELLAPLQSRSDAIGAGRSGVGRREWLKAQALADPQKVPELINRELAAAKDRQRWEQSKRELMQMLQILATPPDDRLEEACHYMGVLWLPSQDR